MAILRLFIYYVWTLQDKNKNKQQLVTFIKKVFNPKYWNQTKDSTKSASVTCDRYKSVTILRDPLLVAFGGRLLFAAAAFGVDALRGFFVFGSAFPMPGPPPGNLSVRCVVQWATSSQFIPREECNPLRMNALMRIFDLNLSWPQKHHTKTQVQSYFVKGMKIEEQFDLNWTTASDINSSPDSEVERRRSWSSQTPELSRLLLSSSTGSCFRRTRLSRDLPLLLLLPFVFAERPMVDENLCERACTKPKWLESEGSMRKWLQTPRPLFNFLNHMNLDFFIKPFEVSYPKNCLAREHIFLDAVKLSWWFIGRLMWNKPKLWAG